MKYIVNKMIDNFISAISKEFNHKVQFWHIYNKKYDLHEIWHDNNQFDNVEFKKILGKNIRLHLYNNDIFNISICHKSEM